MMRTAIQFSHDAAPTGTMVGVAVVDNRGVTPHCSRTRRNRTTWRSFVRNSPHPYEIVLYVLKPAGNLVSRGFADDADQATVVFHTELSRLKQEQLSGDLVILKHNDQPTPVLRHPVRSAACADRSASNQPSRAHQRAHD
jgi:hypothetical protein